MPLDADSVLENSFCLLINRWASRFEKHVYFGVYRSVSKIPS